MFYVSNFSLLLVSTYPFLLVAGRDRERPFSCLEKPHAAWEVEAQQRAYILPPMGSRSEMSIGNLVSWGADVASKMHCGLPAITQAQI